MTTLFDDVIIDRLCASYVLVFAELSILMLSELINFLSRFKSEKRLYPAENARKD